LFGCVCRDQESGAGAGGVLGIGRAGMITVRNAAPSNTARCAHILGLLKQL
jgi:hypothetical protein